MIKSPKQLYKDLIESSKQWNIPWKELKEVLPERTVTYIKSTGYYKVKSIVVFKRVITYKMNEPIE